MEVTRILAEIDAQIAKLQQARGLLSGVSTSTSIAAPAKKAVGRPRKSPEAAAKPAKSSRKKRNLSPEARKRIADAQKRRWADSKKAA